MSQDGYTLAETLAALVMIGLAMGGLTAGVRVIGINQSAADRRLTQTKVGLETDRTLGRLFAGQGPFNTNDVQGLRADEHALDFECGAAVRCGAWMTKDTKGIGLSVVDPHGRTSVPLPGVRSARFAYVGSTATTEVWPPNLRDQADSETLRSVLVLADRGAGEAPIASARIWRQQPLSCAFDPISETCRTATP